MRVRCFAVRCSYPVNSSKILAVRNDMENTADTLRNVILSRHSIRDARNLSHVCSDCCYGATGGSLTAREATCTHVCHMRVHSKHKAQKKRGNLTTQTPLENAFVYCAVAAHCLVATNIRYRDPTKNASTGIKTGCRWRLRRGTTGTKKRRLQGQDAPE